MKIKITQLEKIVKDALLTVYSEQEAELMKDVIMFGELSGRPSHGLLRLLKDNYGVFVDDIQGKPVFKRKTKVSTLIDGKGNPGMLIGSLAMQEVIRLGKEKGIGIVGTKSSINSTGSLSYYCEKIAKENLIAFIFTSCRPMIAPFSSKKALFGTNPLAFGIPSRPYPIIFDMSTAAITYGAILKYKSENKQIPPNMAINSKGEMTQDPDEAMNGALLAFDNSYKGSGLAMMVEILGAVWTGAGFAGTSNESWGNVYMAFSPNLLSDTESLKKRTKQLIRILKNAETRDNSTIRIPGERTLKTRDKNLKKGEIEINETVLKRIQEMIKVKNP